MNDHKKEERQSKLICSQCREKGCTSHTTKLKRCMRCEKSWGIRKFHHKQWKHHEEGQQSLLVCTECKQQDDENLKRLRPLVQKSTFKCNCKNKLGHAERCPLTPTFHGEQRWPGKDKQVREQDRDFLNMLKPQWWARALRRHQ